MDDEIDAMVIKLRRAALNLEGLPADFFNEVADKLIELGGNLDTWYDSARDER